MGHKSKTELRNTQMMDPDQQFLHWSGVWLVVFAWRFGNSSGLAMQKNLFSNLVETQMLRDIFLFIHAAANNSSEDFCIFNFNIK